MRRLLLLLSIVVLVPGAIISAQPAVPTPSPGPQLTRTPLPVEFFETEVLHVYPHDTGAYTQGLVWHDGMLYESVGRENESDLRQVELETGTVLRQVDNAPEDFAEGLALVDDRLIQLTWSQETAYVYDLDTFEPLGTFTYSGEGWGLCYDSEVLWRSDGTQILTAHDPETFEVVREVTVTYQGYPISQIGTPSGRLLSALNELECVDGSVYANVWFTDFIVRIDTPTGQVTGIIDASNLLTAEERAALTDSNAVLNGIAYNPETETFLLTGKYWPVLFEVAFRSVGVIGE